MANRRYHPRRLSVVPFLRRLLRLRQQEHVSRVINGDGDGGSAVSCNHIYGPPFGLSGAGDLSITIATGQRNCRRTRNTTMSATAFAAAFSLLLSPLLLLSPSPSPLILLSPLLQFLLLPLLVDCYMCPPPSLIFAAADDIAAAAVVVDVIAAYTSLSPVWCKPGWPKNS